MSQFGGCCASTEQHRGCPLSPRCWQGGEAAGTFLAVSSWEEPGYSHFGGCRVEFFIFHRWGDEAETFPLMSRWSRGLSVSFSVPGALFCSGMELMANVSATTFWVCFFSLLFSLAGCTLVVQSQFTASLHFLQCKHRAFPLQKRQTLQVPPTSPRLCLSLLLLNDFETQSSS